MLRVVRWGALVLVVLFALLFIPAVFQFVVRHSIRFETWRRGGSVTMEEVRGSFFAPVVVRNSRWHYVSSAGASTDLKIERAEGAFEWRSVLAPRSEQWFRQLTLDGVEGKVTLPLTPHETVAPARRRLAEPSFPLAWFPRPSRVEAQNVNLLFQSEGDSVHLQGSRWMISEVEPGIVELGQLTLDQPWLKRTFRNVRGTTLWQRDNVVVANLQLDKDVLVKSFSAALPEVARGRLDLTLDVTAFGGDIRVQAQTNARSGPVFEASGNFSRIGIAQLATFLGISDAAGGVIKEGYFTFSGSPRDPARAGASLRLEATNFQWESRQWDSLTLGATLLDRRVQVPELVLRQGHNNLSLQGELALPAAATWQAWSQTDLNFTITGQIGNLTELSALLLPEFQYAAGKLSIDGSVKAKAQQFSGHLLVSGSGLAWRNTPIQELHGAIRLAGKEVQIASLDLLNGDDYLHGQGVVSLGADSEYRGDFRASVEDFGKYSAILAGAFWPEPLAGGAAVRWSGQGKDGQHKGRFFTRVQKLRPLRKSGSQPHPVDAELEGSYEPGQTIVSAFKVADEESSFSGQGRLTAEGLEARDLRLVHGGQTRLQGEIHLPTAAWTHWLQELPQAPAAPETPVKVNLKATGLSLSHAVRLSGWKWPVEGFVDGSFAASGKLGQLSLSGQGKLQSGRLPIGWRGDALQNVQAEWKATGQHVEALCSHAEHYTGKYSGEATLDLTKYWNPELVAKARTALALFPVYESLQPYVQNGSGELAPATIWGQAALNLQAEGPLSGATVKGVASLQGLHLGGAPAIGFLWHRPSTLVTLPQLFTVALEPFHRWPLAITVEAVPGARVWPKGGPLTAKLQVSGTAAQPRLEGEVELQNLPAQAGPWPMTIKQAGLRFTASRPGDPMIDLQAVGTIQSLPFNAYVLGPLSLHMAFADSEEALAHLGPQLAPLERDTTPLLILESKEGPREVQRLPWQAIPAIPGAN